MKSGYLEDRYLQNVLKEDGYRFFNWQYLDLFVYFSHHFITIPPVGWVSSAHCNRVPILGTVITENHKGAKICKQLLQSRESYENVARKLVEIAKFYNFDGWLLNIENVIQLEDIPNLAGFVSCLSTMMSDAMPHAKVIWYDSVTKDGFLNWQNELNLKNELFFDKCHGIFLNYCWNEEGLKRTKKISAQKNRTYDVFVGVDVFGRGCYGGGGYSSNKALKIIRDVGLSAAIFANGWVFECQGVKEFLQNEIRFWSLLHPLCSIHGPASLPLSTSFCHGYGHKYFLNGECLSNKEWVSMGMQQIQLVQNSVNSNDEVFSKLCLEDGFIGGSCLKIFKSVPGSQSYLHSIFHCNVTVNEKLLVSFCVKSLVEQIKQECLLLTFTRKDGKQDKVLLVANSHYYPVELRKSEVKNILENADICLLPENGSNGWKQHYFLVEVKKQPCELTDISIGLYQNSLEPFDFLLGQIQIIPINESQIYSVKITDLQAKDMAHFRQIVIDWNCTDMSLVHYYNIYIAILDEQPELVGQSITCKHVYSLREEQQSCDFIITVQPVMRNGWVVPINNCSSVEVEE
ncbi:cytosolic endo-beta-N-acetylglucosaminidase-like isoform X1 [Octopus vulgaris]|nr:cytosolic endo-beta-N-acetylglucosaminidase-like isoform X1 [Octopus vulgaris]